MLPQVRPARLLAEGRVFQLAAVVLAIGSFLAIAPFVGCMNGVPARLCTVIHVAQCAAFLHFVPYQFAFGAVQLVLNLWYCIPRSILVGCASPADIANRTQPVWVVTSLGLLAVMPVVFFEMLACDSLCMPLGGHFVYDLAVALLAAAYSVAAFHTTDGGEGGAAAQKRE